MRRRRDGDGDLAGLREARCRWDFERRQVPPEQYVAWLAEHPYPGGYVGLSIAALSEQANCRCRWCAAALDDIDPREWVDAFRVDR